MKTSKKKLKVDSELVQRFIPFRDETAEEDEYKNRLTLSFSSENPVERAFGEEILSHDAESVDLARLNDGGMLLFNHNPDVVLGRVVRAWLEDGRARATIKWASNEKAREVRKDTENGIYQGVSVGYKINEMKENEKGQFVATRWTPHEISLVSIPADDSPKVGVGRSVQQTKTNDMAKEQDFSSPDWAYNAKQDEYEKESNQFSVIRAIQSLASGRGLSGREAEINQEIEHKTGKRTSGFYVPNKGWSNIEKRTYVTSTGSAGGDLVATNKMPDEFIDILRNKLAVTELGARTLTGMSPGNIEIPRRTGSGGAAFIGADDADSLSETTGTFDTISLTPHTLGSYQKYSHLMSIQALPEIEELIRADMVEKLAQEIDIAAIAGSGSGATPRGILFTTGIGSVAGGTNGLAPTIDNLIDLKAEVGIDSGDANNGAFLTNAKVEKVLSKLKDSQNNYLLNPYTSNLGDAQVCGRRMFVSNNVPSDLTKGSSSGVCSAIIYGDFSQLMVAVFSELEVLVDPFTDFAKGTTGIRALTSVDIGIRHPESFAAMQDALTA